MKYVSELKELENKKFDSVEELEAAEKEVKLAEAKKAEAKELMKKESEKVQDAFKALNAAKRDYNKEVIEARKVYNAAVIAARDAYSKALENADKARVDAEKTYDEALKEFQAKHPEGYRICLKDGDNVVTLASNAAVDYSNLNKEFDDMLTMFSNLLKRW